MRPSAFSPKNTSMVQPRWISQQARIIFTGSTRPDSASNVTYLAGIGPNDYGKIGPLTGKEAPQRAGVLVVRNLKDQGTSVGRSEASRAAGLAAPPATCHPDAERSSRRRNAAVPSGGSAPRESGNEF